MWAGIRVNDLSLVLYRHCRTGTLLLRYDYTLRFVSYDSFSDVRNQMSTYISKNATARHKKNEEKLRR